MDYTVFDIFSKKFQATHYHILLEFWEIEIPWAILYVGPGDLECFIFSML